MKYSIEQLQTLQQVRLSGFDKSCSNDDVFTNEYWDFKSQTDVFLKWLAKMERLERVEYLLADYEVNEFRIKRLNELRANYWMDDN